MDQGHEAASIESGAPTLDDVYRDRNLLAQLAGELARRLGMTVGIGSDPAEPDWPVLYIDLPTGQISWHLPQAELTADFGRYRAAWDGHAVATKHDRIRAFLTDPDEGVVFDRDR